MNWHCRVIESNDLEARARTAGQSLHALTKHLFFFIAHSVTAGLFNPRSRPSLSLRPRPREDRHARSHSLQTRRMQTPRKDRPQLRAKVAKKRQSDCMIDQSICIGSHLWMGNVEEAECQKIALAAITVFKAKSCVQQIACHDSVQNACWISIMHGRRARPRNLTSCAYSC